MSKNAVVVTSDGPAKSEGNGEMGNGNGVSHHLQLERFSDEKEVTQAAISVVNRFDQANTNHAVEGLGSRGQILKRSIEELREVLNKNGQRTILSREQAR